jgi:hypothetical protein
MSLPRGLRNNNPGNIRKSSTVWIGQVSGTDPDFVTFESIEWGYRAIFVLLRNYISKGYDTISKIINRYAPSNENDTTAYINRVAALSNIDKDTVIGRDDGESLIKIVAAISWHENGVKPNFTEVTAGWNKLGTTQVAKTIGFSSVALLFVISIGYLLFEFFKVKPV